MTRKSVPLDDADVQAISQAREDGTLATLAGDDAVKSEATALHAVLSLGLAAIREHRELTGYEAMAANFNDEDRAYHAAMRARRRDRDQA